MQHIGDVVNTSRSRIEALRAAWVQRRADRCRTYGWLPTVHCAECGDTGYPPDRDGETCKTCAIGRARQVALDNEAAWERLVPPRFRGLSLDTHPQAELAAKVRAWLGAVEFSVPFGDAGLPPRVTDGPNLVLLGTTGRGKTGLAYGALRELHRTGLAVRWGSVPALLAGLRPNGAEEPTYTLRSLQRTNVLLLDDFGTEKLSEWAAEQLYLIVNSRYEAKLPTIVTSNLNIEQLEETVGPRIISRLLEKAKVIPVTGPDLREEGSHR